MAFTETDPIRSYYRLEGNADRPLLVLSHSLGLDHGMWDPQMPGLLLAIPGAAVRHARARRH